MATLTSTVSSTVSTTARRRTRAASVGAAVLATSACYVVARLAGTDFKLTDPGKTEAHQLILPEIVAFTLFFSLLGWGTLALLERFTRAATTIWSVAAGSVLVLSFVPIALEQATTSTKVMLTVIHIAVAAALVPLVRRR